MKPEYLTETTLEARNPKHETQIPERTITFPGEIGMLRGEGGEREVRREEAMGEARRGQKERSERHPELLVNYTSSGCT